MESVNSVTVPKAPAPNFSEEKNKGETSTTNETKTKPKRKFNMPNVGVVSAPNISKNPLGDTLRIKKQETPKMAYKDLSGNIKNKGFDFYNITSIGTILFGTIALLIQGHNIKKFFKK